MAIQELRTAKVDLRDSIHTLASDPVPDLDEGQAGGRGAVH
jgi:hypothetical protein